MLILSEVALSLLLLISAGLLAKSFLRLQAVSPGFVAKNLLVMRLSLPQAQYSRPDTVAAFYEQLSSRIGNLPGVESVGATSVLPLSGSNVRINFTVVGRPPLSLSEQPITQYRITGPAYLSTMKIPLLSRSRFCQWRHSADSASRHYQQLFCSPLLARPQSNRFAHKDG